MEGNQAADHGNGRQLLTPLQAAGLLQVKLPPVEWLRESEAPPCRAGRPPVAVPAILRRSLNEASGASEGVRRRTPGVYLRGKTWWIRYYGQYGCRHFERVGPNYRRAVRVRAIEHPARHRHHVHVSHGAVGLRGPEYLRSGLIRPHDVNLVRAMRRANNLSPKLDAGGDRCERV
jgi:hypothetical protein